MIKILIKSLLILIFVSSYSFAEIVKEVKVEGNQRISKETINVIGGIKINTDYNKDNLNRILKNLYNSDFFKDVNLNLENGILSINVIENPIIEEIIIEGLTNQNFVESLSESIVLKSRMSFTENQLQNDINLINNIMKSNGFYFASIKPSIQRNNELNSVQLKIIIDQGDKAKIKKISFIGDKIYKDRKLRGVILSEEYKFWKFISGKKFLNEDLINFDKRLLKNFYLNKGFYDISVNTSFAKIVEDNEFELIYNISAGKKFYFGNLDLKLPLDYNRDNFIKLDKFLSKLNNEPYSIKSIEKILEEIDILALDEQYESVTVNVIENFDNNKLNLTFEILETEKFFIERINIFGNNVTQETVIRNQFEIDEGDPYNEILKNKSINNMKNLNFFKNVTSVVKDGTNDSQKIIDITVEEKATGEITASAGVGTSGNSIGFGVSENNFLGRGIGLDSNISLSTETIKGLFSVNNPNFLNSDKSVYTSIEAQETDKLADFGYKTNKTGFMIGTNFEYLDDFNLGLSTSNFNEKIETDGTASDNMKKQEGDYWDSFVNFKFDYDKRNQKFQTTDGFRSTYFLNLPVISDTNTLKNSYNVKYFTELYEGEYFMCGLNTSQQLSCWGRDHYNQASVLPPLPFTYVSLANEHACAIDTSSTLHCWGRDDYGQSTPPSGTFSAVEASTYHTCAVRTSGEVVCFGYDGYGVISNTTTSGTYTKLVSGDAHFCGLQTNGNVDCWGYQPNYAGTPDGGNFIDIESNLNSTCGILDSGNVICWGQSSANQTSPP